MAGVRRLRKIQLGLETTKGTAVAATALWRGTGVIADQREVVEPDEDIGYLSRLDRTYIPQYLAAVTFDETPATYEQAPYIYSASIDDVVAGTADGAGSDYIYTYNFPTTSDLGVKTYTIEGGDNQQAEEMEYGFVESFTLSGNAAEAINISANWLGRQAQTATFTGAISVPTVRELLFQKSKLYIDGVSTYPATTQVTNTFVNFTFDYTSGWQAVFTGDGNLHFTFNKQVGWEATLQITFEHDATAVAEIANWRNETARSTRILTEGASFTTGGTTYSVYTHILDAVGKWTNFTELQDADGNDQVTGTLSVRYDGTAASAGRIICANELSSLT